MSDTYVLPSSNILDDSYKTCSDWDIFGQDAVGSSNGHLSGTDVSKLLLEKTEAIDAYAQVIVEYLSFANWSRTLEYVRIALHTGGTSCRQWPNSTKHFSRQRQKCSNRDPIHFLNFWVDGRKLSILIQELCGSFLHLRKAFQTTVAVVVPQLITRWLETKPTGVH